VSRVGLNLENQVGVRWAFPSCQRWLLRTRRLAELPGRLCWLGSWRIRITHIAGSWPQYGTKPLRRHATDV